MKKLLFILGLTNCLFGELSILELKNTLRCVQDTDKKMLSPVIGAILWHSGWLENVYRFGPQDSACVKLIQKIFNYNETTNNFAITKSLTSPAHLLRVYGLIDNLIGWYLENKATMFKSLYEKLALVQQNKLSRKTYNAAWQAFTTLNKKLSKELQAICLQNIQAWQGILQKAKDDDEAKKLEKGKAESESLPSIKITSDQASKGTEAVLNKLQSDLLTPIENAFNELQSPDAPFPAYALDQILVAYWFAAQEDTTHVAPYINDILLDKTSCLEKLPDRYNFKDLEEVPPLTDHEKLALWIIFQHQGGGEFPPKVNQESYEYQTEKDIPDCVESTLHNLINLLLYKPGYGVYDLSLIPTLSEEVKGFYAQYPLKETQNHHAGQAWFELIANLKDKDSTITYNRGICEAFGDETNVVKMLNALLGTTFKQFEDLAQLSSDSRKITVTKKRDELYTISIGSNSADVGLHHRHDSFESNISPEKARKLEETFAALVRDIADQLSQALLLFDPQLVDITKDQYPFINYQVYAKNLADVNACVSVVEQLAKIVGNTLKQNDPFFKLLTHLIDDTILARDKNLFGKTLGALMSHIDVDSDAFKYIVLAKESDLQKLLFTGAQFGASPSIITYLLGQGVPISQHDAYGKTALMMAAKNGHKDIVQLLLDKDAKVDDEGRFGETALMTAAASDHQDIVSLLIDKGANVNDKGHDGITALMLAAINGHKDIVQLLLDKGANINDEDRRGKTALVAAAVTGHKDIVQLLLDKGANVNDKDHEGITALMMAAASDHKDIAQLLLDKGAKVDDKNTYGQTALMLARDPAIIKILQEAVKKQAAQAAHSAVRARKTFVDGART